MFFALALVADNVTFSTKMHIPLLIVIAPIFFTDWLAYLMRERFQVLGAFLLVSIAGIVVIVSKGNAGTSLVKNLFLLVPSYQLLVLYLEYALFNRFVGRAPKSIAFQYESGLWPDRIFFFVAAITCGLVPVLVLVALK